MSRTVALAAVLCCTGCLGFHRGALPGESKIGQYAEVEGARVRYTDEGQGALPPVVMLHGFGASLELRKLYPVLDDPDAEANDLIRVIDESGEDYVYPARLFQRLKLPGEVQRALRLAS